jgi:hypothetical protein
MRDLIVTENSLTAASSFESLRAIQEVLLPDH